MKKKGYGIYTFLTLKLLLALGTLLLMQVAFYVSNLRIFHLSGWHEVGGVVLGNMVFGIATVATFMAPYMLLMLLPLTRVRWRRVYRTIAEVFYIIPMLLILVPRGCNAAYYQYTYRLLSDEIFSYLGIGGQMGSLLPHFAVDYWYAWLLPLVLMIAFLLVNHRIRLAVRNPYNKHLVPDIVGFLFGIAIIVALMSAVKSPAEAARYCQPKNTALVNNDAYNIVLTLFTPELSEVQRVPLKQYNAVHTACHTADSDSTIVATVRRPNVVLIIVESLGQEFMGCYNTQPRADTRTPFLDSLAMHCTLYDGRANGKKSIEGITAINTGLPNLMAQPLTNSVYGTDTFRGLPEAMRRNGYHTAFYHGTYNGVMDFDRTCMKIGFDHYLGKNEYEAEGQGKASDYDGVWGILDEPFLQYTVRHISTTPEPFFAEVFTVSSHHPYPMPTEYKERFVEGRHPILKCVEYTDYALRRFFEAARRQPWYDSTIFIITGDHSGHGLSREYNDYDGWYRIPMMVYDPQHPEGHRSQRIVQQTDIYPTLVDLLNLDVEPYVCFGTSVLQQPDSGWQVYFGNGYHVLVTADATSPSNHRTAVIMGRHTFGEHRDIEFLHSIISEYNYRVINDKLIIQ